MKYRLTLFLLVAFGLLDGPCCEVVANWTSVSYVGGIFGTDNGTEPEYNSGFDIGFGPVNDSVFDFRVDTEFNDSNLNSGTTPGVGAGHDAEVDSEDDLYRMLISDIDKIGNQLMNLRNDFDKNGSLNQIDTIVEELNTIRITFKVLHRKYEIKPCKEEDSILNRRMLYSADTETVNRPMPIAKPPLPAGHFNMDLKPRAEAGTPPLHIIEPISNFSIVPKWSKVAYVALDPIPANNSPYQCLGCHDYLTKTFQPDLQMTKPSSSSASKLTKKHKKMITVPVTTTISPLMGKQLRKRKVTTSSTTTRTTTKMIGSTVTRRKLKRTRKSTTVTVGE